MRTASIFAAALAVLLAALAIFAPRMVDVRGLAPTIGAELSAATGRDVRIRGEVLLSLVPTPRLILRDVASVADAAVGFALNAPEVRAELAWGELALGRYVITELRLIEPQIELASDRIDALALALPRLRLERARIAILRGTHTTRIEALNADLSLAATGTLSWTASGLVEGIAIDGSGRLGPAASSGRRNLQATVRLPEADLVLEASGQRDAVSIFTGRVTITGARAADALSAGLDLNVDPGRWSWSSEGFTLSGEIKIDSDKIAVANAELKLGDQVGILSVTLADMRTSSPRFDLRLAASAVDVLKWLPARPNPEPAARGAAVSSIAALLVGPRASWHGEVAIDVPLARLGAQSVRDIRVSASRIDATWNIRAATATFPGQTRLSFAGFARTDEAAGASAEGSWQADIQDGRGLLAWLGLEASDLPPERLATLRGAGTVQASASLVVLNDLTLAVDGSQAKGRIAVDMNGRAPLTVDLDVDRLALDAYGPIIARLLIPAAPAATAPSPAGYGLAPVPPWLASLAKVRGALRLRVEQLTWRDLLTAKLGADIVLADGAADIRSLALEDPQGAAVWIGGRIETLDAVPLVKNLQIDAKVTDTARFARVLRIDLPQPVRNLAPWTATAAFNGTSVESALTLTGLLGGIALSARGTMGVVENALRMDVSFDFAHPDTGALRRKMWPGQAFAVEVGGPLSVAGKLALNSRAIELRDGALAVGPHRLRAALSAVPAERIFNARVSDIDFDLRPWAPTLPPPPLLPMGWRGEVALSGSHWRSFGIDARDFAATLVATPDDIRLAGWQGRLFDGAAQVAMTWSRAADETAPETKRRAFKGQVMLENADAEAMLGGARSAPRSARADLSLGLETAGNSVDEMMATATGSGALAVTVPPGAALKGGLAALAALARNEAPDGRGAAALEVSATFALENAALIVTAGDLRTNAYTGSLQGSVDLARRALDFSGTLKLKDRALIVGEAARLVLPPSTAFTVKGAVEAPTVTLSAPR